MKKVLLILWILFTVALIGALFSGCSSMTWLPFVNESAIARANSNQGVVFTTEGFLYVGVTEVAETLAEAEEKAKKSGALLLREEIYSRHAPSLHDRLFPMSVEVVSITSSETERGFTVSVVSRCPVQ